MPIQQIKSGVIADDAVTAAKLDDSTSQLFGFRNRIINGDMRIAQRKTSATNNSEASGSLRYDTIDRWGYWAASGNLFSVEQSTVAPPGFSHSALITSLTAYTVSTGGYATFSTRIEGFNFSDFGFGTANAKSLTVSFWVRSSITGTFPFYLFNSGYSRNFVSTFTINATNTWEYKTIFVPGDTTGTWVGATNGIGIELGFTLAAGTSWFNSADTWTGGSYDIGLSGATNLLATNGATMHITGVQLEVGSVATPFERRLYGLELQLCQRYYEQYKNYYNFTAKVPNSSYTSKAVIDWQFLVEKRATPTISQISGTTVQLDRFGIGAITPSSVDVYGRTTTMGLMEFSLSTGYTTGESMALTGTYYQASAEL